MEKYQRQLILLLGFMTILISASLFLFVYAPGGGLEGPTYDLGFDKMGAAMKDNFVVEMFMKGLGSNSTIG